MKRFITNMLASGLVCAGMVAALTSRPVAAADDAVVQADRALVAALEKGDQAAANKLLDPDFTWIDRDGVMWAREDALRAGLKPLVPGASDIQITEHKYGKLVWIQENQGKKYAAHFWVQRPAGWRLLHTNEIDVRPAEPNSNTRPNFAVDCINPCKEIPYTPLSASEKAALEAWQDQESATGDHDKRLGENLRSVHSENGVTPTTAERRAATIKAAQAPTNRNLPPVGAAPVLWMRTWDFGDAVVSIMLQPTYGGKAYWSSRVFGNHGGYWQMDESYHTTVRTAPAMTAVPLRSKN